MTWIPDSPRFTPCFTATVLSYLPAAVLLLAAPLEAARCLTSPSRGVPWAARLLARLGPVSSTPT